jgi:hypothetical protein
MFVGSMRFALDTVEEGGVPEPLQTSYNDFETLSQQSSEEFDLPSENAPNNPIGDLYAFYLELMLQGAQPYPGDPKSRTSEECFEEKRFLAYRISETQYIVMDSELDEDHTLEAQWLQDPEFMPGVWYAGIRARVVGLSTAESLKAVRHRSEIGDIFAGAVQILLEKHFSSQGEEITQLDRFEIVSEGENLIISDRVLATCFKLPREFLNNTQFDLLQCCKRSRFLPAP